ncbi:MAG: translation elongation factor Ts [Schleiferiaceae bacterium]|nr:translation elongation factor Ts [Schleiferiaceae bacterium]
MVKITAADVNALRKQTGAGMMDCKKALVEAEGDMEKAIDVLRKKGQKVAAKRADRDASEGAVLAMTNADNNYGVIVSLNCETDFVAKNESYLALATKITTIALENRPADTEALLALPYEGNLTVADKLVEQTGVIGEKLEINGYEQLEGNFVAPYIHNGNKLATLVALSAAAPEAGRNVAMQAAAMSPIALDRSAVSQETIDRELEVGKDLARQEGKPEEMLDKIAQGRLNKFFKESTLVEQEYISDNKLTVAKYLDSVEKGLVATGFRRVGLGV